MIGKINRYNWTYNDVQRMIASNTKLVDENRQLKSDVRLLVYYCVNRSKLTDTEVEAAKLIIEQYSGKEKEDGKLQDDVCK